MKSGSEDTDFRLHAAAKKLASVVEASRGGEASLRGSFEAPKSPETPDVERDDVVASPLKKARKISIAALESAEGSLQDAIAARAGAVAEAEGLRISVKKAEAEVGKLRKALVRKALQEGDGPGKRGPGLAGLTDEAMTALAEAKAEAEARLAGLVKEKAEVEARLAFANQEKRALDAELGQSKLEREYRQSKLAEADGQIAELEANLATIVKVGRALFLCTYPHRDSEMMHHCLRFSKTGKRSDSLLRCTGLWPQDEKLIVLHLRSLSSIGTVTSLTRRTILGLVVRTYFPPILFQCLRVIFRRTVSF